MAYHRYEVSGFILGVYDRGEFDSVVQAYTKELGFISAKATGFRRHLGKLRAHIQPLSHTELSLVRGKEYWRLIGARNSEHYWPRKKYSSEVRQLMTQLLNMLKRLVHGESQNQELFVVLSSIFEYLTKDENYRVFSSEELLIVEVVAVARILYTLGYIANTEAYGTLISESVCNDDVFFFAEVHKDALVKDINHALNATNL